MPLIIFIELLIGSTCFGKYYAHHQDIATMMLITTLVAGVVSGLQAKARFDVVL